MREDFGIMADTIVDVDVRLTPPYPCGAPNYRFIPTTASRACLIEQGPDVYMDDFRYPIPTLSGSVLWSFRGDHIKRLGIICVGFKPRSAILPMRIDPWV